MDAVMLLKDDHKTVEALLKRCEKAGDGAVKEKRKIVDRIIEELSVHAAIEEQLFYPFTRQTAPETESVALESLEEHHIVKWVISELEHMEPTVSGVVHGGAAASGDVVDAVLSRRKRPVAVGGNNTADSKRSR